MKPKYVFKGMLVQYGCRTAQDLADLLEISPTTAGKLLREPERLTLTQLKRIYGYLPMTEGDAHRIMMAILEERP